MHRITVIRDYSMLATPLWLNQNDKDTELHFCTRDVLQKVLEKNGVGNFDHLIDVLSGLAKERLDDCTYIQVKRTFPESGVFTGHVLRINTKCEDAKCVLIEWQDSTRGLYTVEQASSFINPDYQNKASLSKKLQLAENTLNVRPLPWILCTL